ncbi:MAG TPA: Flp family type IVb pilin [Coriobacteriia bacterium]|nr:Flp family type IVb pilin [Coriobacteriia bacterium]
MRRLLELISRDEAATSVEYALMAGLVAVVIAASVATFGLAVAGLFNVPAF